MAPPSIRLFSTDLDGTLLGNPVACWRFADTWNTLAKDRRPVLVYNTGRSVAATLAVVRERRLPAADYIIGSIGTELHDARGATMDDFHARFASWDVTRIDRIVATTTPALKQPAEFQNAFKSSWHWVQARRPEVEQLAERIRTTGIRAHVDYSCHYYLDVVPADAGKGNALAWLCGQLRIALENVLVAGDTGNDTSMFLLPGVKGIVVENALPELRAAVVRLPVFTAHAQTADGVLEGLHHYKLVPKSVRTTEARPPGG